MVADREGVATPYALFHLQERGALFVPAGTPVYEGMVVGEYSRDADLDVNVCREKKLSNMRAAGHDEAVRLVDRKSTRLNSSHVRISYAVFCLKKKKKNYWQR